MPDNTNPANLVLHFIVPTVVTDGNSIAINTDGDVPTVTFFQIRAQDGNTVQADAVASIRMRGLDELKSLRANIDEAIHNHESREK